MSIVVAVNAGGTVQMVASQPRPEEQRYLLFDVVFHEQLNKQRRALMFFLDLAMSTKRVLVLPRARLLRRTEHGQFAAEAEYVRWGELLNLSALNELHPTIELETFLDRHGRIDLHITDTHKACAPATDQRLRFNGLDAVLALQTRCQAGQSTSARLLGSAEASIAFAQVTNQLGQGRVRPLRPYVRFERSVYERATAFVATSFGGAPYICIHWRRTDFLLVRRTQPGVLQSAQQMVRHAQRAMRRYRVQHVYLATDSDDPAELAYVEAMLKPARYSTSAASAASTLESVDIANVEIAICAGAEFFLGTKTSSFTLAIKEEREAVFGLAADTAMDMDQFEAGAPDERLGDAGRTSPAEAMGQAGAGAAASAEPKQPPGGSGGAPTPPRRIAALNQYLLFDVVFHEQLNKQRRALMFFLDLAMSTKRVLVLPRARLLRRTEHGQFAAEAEYVRWGELFNLSALNELHPAIELETFLDRHGRIDMHITDTHKACDSARDQRVHFNGLDAVPAHSTECRQAAQHNPAAMRAAKGSSIAFAQVTNQLGQDRVRPLRPYVRFERSVYERATAFVATAFGGAPYISLHWRRTDFLLVRRTQPGVLQSAEKMVRHAQRAMRRYRVQHVYLATDSDDPAELAYVEAMLKPARYSASAASAASTRESVDIANVEIAICAGAEFFLGTKTSSFTLAIKEEREAVFGLAADTAMDMDVLHDAGGSPRVVEGKDEL